MSIAEEIPTEDNLPESGNQAKVPDLLQNSTFAVVDRPIVQRSLTETIETENDQGDVGFIQVSVEPLALGIVNALEDAVLQVIETVTSVGKRLKPSKAPAARSDASKKGKPFFMPVSRIPSIRLKEGFQGFVSGVGEIAQNGVNVVTGLAGCLQESFSCMGKVIMNPAQKPQSKNRAVSKEVSVPVA